MEKIFKTALLFILSGLLIGCSTINSQEIANTDTEISEEVESLHKMKNISSNQEEMDLEDIIVKMKDTLNIQDQYDDISTEEYNDDVNGKTYYVSYSNTEKGDSLSFETDQYGNLIRFVKYSEENYNNDFSTFKRDQGLISVIDFLTSLYGKASEEFIIEDFTEVNSLDSNYHSFIVTRVVNGIKVPKDTIEIVVNKSNLEVIEFYLETSTSNDFSDTSYFENLKGIKDKDQAFEKYKEANKIYTGYLGVISYENNPKGERIYYPIHATYPPEIPIYGKTLETSHILTSGRNYYYDLAEESKIDASGPGLNKMEKVHFEKIENQKSLDQAEEYARKLFELDSSYKLTSSNFGESYGNKGHYMWSLSFDKENESIYVNLLASDLTLLDYNRILEDQSGKNIKSNEDNIEEYINLANKFIRKKGNLPLENLELLEGGKGPQGGSSHKLQYMRKLDSGNYLYSDIITIRIDKNTSQVKDYNRYWDFNFEEPSLDFNIKASEAYDLIEEKIPFELLYLRNYLEAGEKVKAYYIFDNIDEYPSSGLIVNAENGNLIDLYGQPIVTNTAIEYSDLDQAENPEIITLLANNKICFPGGQLKAKENINQLDLFRIFASEYYSDRSVSNLTEEEIYQAVEYLEIIGEEERNPEKLITQSDYCRYLSSFLNYDHISSMNHIFEDNYEDIDKNHSDFGHLVVAKAKGLIETDSENKLNPDKNITREEALYNYYKLISIYNN